MTSSYDYYNRTMEMEEDTFRQTKKLTNLATCGTVRDAFLQHGLAPDDIIDRREQVLMFRRIENEMEQSLKELMSDGHFDEAKELGRRLEALRVEFGGLQLHDEQQRQNRQNALFKKARSIFNPAMKMRHAYEENNVEKQCHEEEADTQRRFQIQDENLALELSRIERPRMKYSKRRMELKNAEIRLCSLKQYDDAKNVRKMLRKIDAKEEAEFNRKFEAKLQAKVDKMAALHKGDSGRLEEKLSATRWRDFRRREHEAAVARQNVKNKLKDMKHFQLMDTKLKPELIVKPSALLQKRKNHSQTSSAMRGTQFLDKVKGKKVGDAVFIESLVNVHNFGDKKLSGTIKYEQEPVFGVKPYSNENVELGKELFDKFVDPYDGMGLRVKVRHGL